MAGLFVVGQSPTELKDITLFAVQEIHTSLSHVIYLWATLACDLVMLIENHLIESVTKGER